MAIDREVQVRLILRAKEALDSAEALKNTLKDISKLNIGALSKQIEELSKLAKLNLNEIQGGLNNVSKASTNVVKTIEQEIKAWKEVAKAREDALSKSPSTNKIKQTLDDTEKQLEKLKVSEDQWWKMFTDREYLLAKGRSHLFWIATGAFFDTALSIPGEIVDNIKKIEQGMAGMMQVLPQLHHDQAELNRVTQEFLGIAAQYGEKIEDVIEAGQLWGRAYKDVNTIMALLHSSSILAVADNFSLKEANKALEATMAQFGWQAKNSAEALAYSMRIVDSWTMVAHNAQISAKDLAAANERTASTARLVGVDFDFLQAMIAAAVRNTARSGAEIGNMLKTVFGSFHSEKAIKEIEALGVAVKKVGEDGKEEFRSFQEVMIDLMLATTASKQNMEELFKSVAGGKFQWAKFAAAFDYKEIMRVMELSMSSTGMAVKQVEYQLDTIARKSQQLTAEMQKLIMNPAQSGLAQFIKDTIDGMIALIRVLQQIPGEFYKFAGYGVIFYTTYKLLQMTTRGIETVVLALRVKTAATVTDTVATNAETAAITKNTAAMEANAVATGAVARAKAGLTAVGSLLGGIIRSLGGVFGLATIVLLEFGSAIIDTKSKQESMLESINKTIASHNAEIEMYQNRLKYIDILTDAYNKLKDQLENAEEGSQEYHKIQERLKETEELLTKVIGEQAMERFKAHSKDKEGIAEVKKEYESKINEIKEILADYTTQQYKATQAVIDASKARIEQIKNESFEFAKSFSSMADILDWWDSLLAKYHRSMANFYRTQANALKGTGELKDSDLLGIEMLNFANAEDIEKKAEEHEREVENIKNKMISREAAKIREAMEIAQNTMNGGRVNFNPPIIGGTEVPEGEDKNKNGNAKPPSDYSHERFRSEVELKLKQKFKEIEIAANDYAVALDNVRTKEEMQGNTAAIIIERYGLLKSRIDELAKEESELATMREGFMEQLSQKMEEDSEFNEFMSQVVDGWDKMTKAEKQAAAIQRADFIQNYKDIYVLIEAIIKLQEKESELYKNRAKLINDKTKIEIGDTQNWRKILEKEMEDIEIGHLEKQGEIKRKASPLQIFQERDADIEYLDQKLKKLQEAKKKLEEEINQLTSKGLPTSEFERELQKIRKEIETTNQEMERLQKETIKNVRKNVADLFLDMAQNGRSFRDIWKNLWNDLARDAIYALLKINNSAPSLLTQVFSLLGVKIPTTVPSNAGAVAKTTAHNGGIITSFPKMHSGGVVMPLGQPVVPQLRNDEVIRILQVGEEVNSIRDRRSNEILGAVAMKAIESQNQKPTQIIINAVDSRSFVEYLDAHGDALVAILRKRGAYNNRI